MDDDVARDFGDRSRECLDGVRVEALLRGELSHTPSRRADVRLVAEYEVARQLLDQAPGPPGAVSVRRGSRAMRPEHNGIMNDFPGYRESPRGSSTSSIESAARYEWRRREARFHGVSCLVPARRTR